MRDVTFTRTTDKTRDHSGHDHAVGAGSARNHFPWGYRPLWITYHYITVWLRIRAGAAGPGKVAIERAELDRMRMLGEQLEQRIESLETILDTEAPEWRKR